MASPPKRLGLEAIVSCSPRFLHPKKVKDEFFTGPHPGRLSGLKVVGRKQLRLSGKLHSCVVLSVAKESKPFEFFAIETKVVVQTEGPPAQFFPQTENSSESDDEEEGEGEGEEEEEGNTGRTPFMASEIPAELFASLNLREEDVLPGDEPNVENIPNETSPQPPSSLNWGVDATIDPSAKDGFKGGARLLHFEAQHDDPHFLAKLFLHFLPVAFLELVVVPETNAFAPGLSLTYAELLIWLSLWLLMSLHDCPDRRSFWSVSAPGVFSECPVRLNEFMSRDRFERILRALRLTDQKQVHGKKDPFLEIRMLIAAWNKNLSEHFSPGEFVCLDESMSVWISKRRCPGFMIVPRKPHPLGNEYHTIADARTKILFWMEMREGKDSPAHIRKEFDDKGGPTVGLVLRATETIHHTGRKVVMDSGFCVSEGLVQLRKKGLFGCMVVKKKRYWPKGVPGDDVIAHMLEKEVGAAAVAELEWNKQAIRLFAVREPDYVFQMISTFGVSDASVTPRVRYWQADGQTIFKTIFYPIPVDQYYLFRHSIDDNNNSRQGRHSIEAAWGTHNWAHRQLCFCISVSEVNSKYAYEAFYEDQSPPTMVQFRRTLAQQLILYAMALQKPSPTSTPPVRRKKSTVTLTHDLVKIPPFCGRPVDGEWTKAKTEFSQHRCQGKSCMSASGKTKTKTSYHCTCSKSLALCHGCYSIHLHEVFAQCLEKGTPF